MALLSDPDPREASAFAAFHRTYGATPFQEVAVLIPAYREAANIGPVLQELPSEVLGRRVSVLVIVDGPEDGTSEIAKAQGAFVTATGDKRGQGAALRLGYRLAVAHGSQFLVTIDADGQYHASDIPVVLAPLVDGEADFVSGSRRLGADGTTDRVRALGVEVFSAVIGLLTGHAITDPAFGLRAMTAAVARVVTLEQPQYQASELLIGAILRGFRVIERPATMRVRRAEKTRKGPNFLYGYRFGKVVLRTWWRDRGKSGS